MDFLLSALTVLFVALLLAAAVTFGFVLLVWFLAVAFVIAAGVLIREWWRRWRFVRNAEQRPPKVIDAEYKDITHREDL